MDDTLAAAQAAAVAKDYPAAIAQYESLLSGGAEAVAGILHNLVPMYVANRQMSRALAAAQSLCYFAPLQPRSWMILEHMQEKLGMQDVALASCYRALELEAADVSANETRLFLLAGRLHPEEHRACAEEWYQHLPKPPAAYRHSPRTSNSLPSRTRVGFVGGDFRTHVTDRYVYPLLQLMDKGRFDITCFDNTEHLDSMSVKLRSIEGTTWISIFGRTDEDVAELINQMEIDVLVDLSGLTAGNRLRVFQRQPAPVQVTMLGYPATTGATCFNWRIADVEEQSQYTEPLWKLPTAGAPLPLSPDLPVTSLPAHRNGYITFGYVNGLRKLTPEMIQQFIQVLKAVPKSCLLLMVPGAADEETAVSILRRFDLVQNRILLTESQGGEAFCKILGAIDIALDPSPYGGLTTSFDCLYHGVPIVATRGDRRMCADAWRLQERLYRWNNDYVEIARWLAADLTRLAQIRAESRTNLLQHAAGQPEEWVKSMEAAFEGMVEGVPEAVEDTFRPIVMPTITLTSVAAA